MLDVVVISSAPPPNALADRCANTLPSIVEFHADLESIVRDAKLILSREIRHGILKLTPERRGAIAEEKAASDAEG